MCQRDIFLSKLKEISAGTECKIPYGRAMLHAYLVKTGLQYQKADNQKVIMESPRLVVWRYKHLIKVLKYREDDDLIVYLDKTWFVSHDTVRMLWSAGTKSCYLSGPLPKGKREVKCHAGKSKSFSEHSLLLCGK